jgi:hypothetical protein
MLNSRKTSFQQSFNVSLILVQGRLPAAEKCEHKSKKLVEKKVIDVEELPAAYCATITKTTYQILYECKDCGEKWTQTKGDTKFD